MAELIVALDTDNGQDALEMASTLLSRVRWFKVGLELFISAGPAIVASLRSLAENTRVFLDLKFYDIPNTVEKAAMAAARIGAAMITVHCQAGAKTLAALMSAFKTLEHPPLVMGVTALTSFKAGEMPGISGTPAQFGLELAGVAFANGLNGVICSGHEVPVIKETFPSLLCVCPGIRPAGSGCGDQARVMTPEQAVLAGADFLVVGRPVTASPKPLAAAAAILEEMDAALQKCR